MLYFFLFATVVVDRYKNGAILLLLLWVGQESLIMKFNIAENLFQVTIDFFYLVFSRLFLILELIIVGANEDCADSLSGDKPLLR